MAGSMTAARDTSSELAHGMWTNVVRDGEEDLVAVEEPLEIRVDGAPLAVTMRTPGHDEELALGFLFTEGLIDEPRRAGLTADLAANTIEVEGPMSRDPGARSFYTTSSCGVCGKGALEEVAVHSEPATPGPEIDRALLASLPDRLRQPTFERTGGLHATGLFAPDGALLCVREDVGPPQRHGQGRRPGAARRRAAAARADPVRQRQAVVRARPEGGRGRSADSRRAWARRARWR